MIIYQCDLCPAQTVPLRCTGYLPDAPVGWQIIEEINAKEPNETHHVCPMCIQIIGLDKLTGK